MTYKIFCTGGTGYIGGDFLVEVTQAHPDWQITCLVRDVKKIPALTAAFPGIRIVEGTLGSVDIIEAEAQAADVVFHSANCDHMPSAEAISRGLANKRSGKPTYWIHTSGAGILTFNNFAKNSYGYALESDSKVFDDWDHVDELTNLPDRALHRHVDKIVFAASSRSSSDIKTAIVCPPCIYGAGRGPGNTRSVQIYVATEVMLQHDRAVKLGTGANYWNAVHIQDLSRLYLLLVEAAVNSPITASWNETGYYFAENGEFVWGDLIQAIATEAKDQGHISSSQVHSIGMKEALSLHPWLPYLTGTTSRGRSKRAQQLLGWKPVKRNVYEEIPDIVRDEAARLNSRSNKL